MAPVQELDPAFYSSIGLKYEQGFAQDEGLLAFLNHVIPQLPPRSRVLDAGCGTGRPVAAALASAGHRVTGIDMSDTMIALSKAAVEPLAHPDAPVEFHLIDMRDYAPKEGELFDGVFTILSLFFLDREEIEDMTRKWSNFLKPGGLLCVCAIAAEDLDVEGVGGKYDADGLVARGIKGNFFGKEVQTMLFTRKGWAEILVKNGFAVKYEHTERYVPPPEAESDVEDHYFIIAEKASP